MLKLVTIPVTTLAFVIFMPLVGFWAAGYACWLGVRRFCLRAGRDAR